MVSWFGPQNQVDFGLSVAPQNRLSELGVGHASRSNGLLHVEASLFRVFQSGLKTGGGATTVVHVAPSQRVRRRKVEDRWIDATGYVGPYYPTFVVFNVLGPRDIVVS
jgi:hypothetical protein